MKATTKIALKKYLLTPLVFFIAFWPVPILINSSQQDYLWLFLLPGAWFYFVPAFATFLIIFYCWWHISGERAIAYYFILFVLSASFFYGCFAYAMMAEQSFAGVSLFGQISFWSVWAYFLFGLILDYRYAMGKK